MKFSKVHIPNIVINDPIFNKDDNAFYSLVELIIGDNTTSITFETDKMKIKSIERIKLTLEFIINHPEFFKFMYGLDQYVLEAMVDNGKAWFGKAPNYDTIDRLFKRSIIPQTSLVSYPMMEFLLDDTCTIRDINGSILDIQELDENNEVTCKISIRQVVFLENKFYLDFKVEDIKVENYVCQQTECLFSDTE